MADLMYYICTTDSLLVAKTMCSGIPQAYRAPGYYRIARTHQDTSSIQIPFPDPHHV